MSAARKPTGPRTVAVSAFRDGITFIVQIDVLDDEGKETGQRQYIDGVVAQTEEQAIDWAIAQIKQQAN
jgi:hypothetical protein